MKLSNLKVIVKPEQINKISYLPYPHNKSFKDSILSFAHCEVPGAKFDNGITIESNEKWKADNTFVIGHLHNSHQVGRARYVGSPYQLSWEETPKKYWEEVVVAKITTSKNTYNLSCRQHPIKQRWLLEVVKIKHENDFQNLKTKPNTYTKLIIPKDIIIPKNFFTSNPTFHFKHELKKSSKNQESISTADFKSKEFEQQCREYLSKNLKPKQVDKGIKILFDTLKEVEE